MTCSLHKWLLLLVSISAARSATLTICEGERRFIQCPTGESIQISDVEWGRTDASICPHETADTSDIYCYTLPGTLEKIQRLANDRNSYWLNALGNMWGEPCSGIYKYLSITYECRACVDVDPNCSEDQCDSSYDTCYKTCSECHLNDCGNAFSGLDDCDTMAGNGDCGGWWMTFNCAQSCGECPPENPGCGNNYDPDSDCDMWGGWGDCWKESSYQWMYSYCAETCKACAMTAPEELLPTTTTTTLAPAIQTGDGAFVKQGSADGSSSTFDTCQGQSLKLQCPDGLFISIDGMFFGRTDANACPHEFGNTGVTDCFPDPANVDKLAKYCDGRPECWFIAESYIWGNPCPGTYKVASVSFSCKACTNDASCPSDPDCSVVSDMESCFKTCSHCDDGCVNTFGRNCEDWALDGECTTDWMASNCAYSCGVCSASDQDCFNIHDSSRLCDEYAMTGECEANPYWMYTYCADSCRKCSAEIPSMLPQETAYTCEGRNIELKCPYMYHISIDELFYGRLPDTDFCPHESIFTDNCPSNPENRDRLYKTCDGRRSCWFSAWNGLWGDPCYGTYKAASVKYTCKLCENQQKEKKCKKLKGNCPADSKKYTRNRDACFESCTDCENRECGNSYYTSRDCRKWAGDGECTNNADWMPKNCKLSCGECSLPDPDCFDAVNGALWCDFWAMYGECENNPKWMSINCAESCGTCSSLPLLTMESKTEEVCDGMNKELKCPYGYAIEVESMFYGRDRRKICDHHKSIKTTKCPSDENNIHKLAYVCNGRSSCWFSALSDLWTDMCPGTYKFGTVTYTCKLCIDRLPTFDCEQKKFNGECSNKNVEDVCYKTCSSCDTNDCGNTYIADPGCDYLVGLAECYKNPETMAAICPGYCGSYKSLGEANNKYGGTSVLCDRKAMSGECETNRQWMEANCRESCHFCDSNPVQVDP